MTMAEKMARAMCDGNWDAKDFTETANGEEPEEQRAYWLDKALDSLEAMREPTPEMLGAAWREIIADKKAAGIARLGPGPGVSDWWRAMVNAAILEQNQ